MAAKKQGKSKKKARRRLRFQEQIKQAQFLERVKRHELAAGREILDAAPDRVKMSQVILDFVGPLLESLEPETSANKIIGVAILAWNLSLLPEEEHRDILDKMAGELAPGSKDVEQMKDVLAWLVDRRRRHFTQERRRVLDYRLSERGDQRSLQVVSVSDPSDR